MKLNEVLDARRGEILSYLYNVTNGVVQHGLFQGMKVLKKSKWGDGDLGAKLLGIYEDELFLILEKVLKDNHDVIVNYGCAEGFYGVGLAKLLPASKVIMMDIEPELLKIAEENSKLNQVVNIEISSDCNNKVYFESLIADASNPFILMDCEGYEDFMLDPIEIPSLLKSTILVEMHDCFHPGLTENIIYKFNDTHDLQGISQGSKNLHIEPILELSDTDKWIIANENRPKTMHWIHMIPKKIKEDKQC